MFDPNPKLQRPLEANLELRSFLEYAQYVENLEWLLIFLCVPVCSSRDVSGIRIMASTIAK